MTTAAVRAQTVMTTAFKRSTSCPTVTSHEVVFKFEGEGVRKNK